MKVSTPKSRQDLHIKRHDRVLEVGPGNRPTFRADVLVEKFLGDDTHRRGGLRIFPHQQLVNAAAEALPFADKEFDYVICNQVLEHSDDPAQFLREVTRVGKAGYIETPSLLGEWLFPKNRTGGSCSTSATNWFSTTNSAYPATMPTITENCS